MPERRRKGTGGPRRPEEAEQAPDPALAGVVDRQLTEVEVVAGRLVSQSPPCRVAGGG
jgi:hypothetical protein